MSVPTKVTVKTTQPHGMGGKKWRECMKKAFAKVGEFWHRKYLPEHFKPYARTRYGYRNRSKVYRDKKEALAKRGIVEDGGQQPLVFRGILRKRVTEFAGIRPFPTRVRIEVMAPSYITRRPKPGNPDTYNEIIRTNEQERKKIDELLNEEATAFANSWKQEQTTTVG